MESLTPTQQKIRRVAEYFLWARQQDFTYWFTGKWGRSKMIEYNLPRMVEKGAITAVRFGRHLVYSAGKKRANNTADIEHGLISTEGLLRVKTAKSGEIISENFFRAINLGSVPEWGVIYAKKLFLFEYGTADNFRRTRLMKKKVETYAKVLGKFRRYFGKEPIVLFVFDAEPYKVRHFVGKYGRHECFYFCDLASFKNVNWGEQLVAPLYYWLDGERYSLTS